MKKCGVCGWREIDVQEVIIRGKKYVACALCRSWI